MRLYKTSLQNARGYLQLLKAIVALDDARIYEGESRLLFTSCSEPSSKGLCQLTLDRFTDLGAYEYYHRDELRALTAQERVQIRIPDYVRANYRQFLVIANVETHLLTFPIRDRGRTISAGQLKKVLLELTSSPTIFETFGSVAVDIETEAAPIERILKASQLRRLTIELSRPNTFFGNLDEAWEDQLRSHGVKEQRIELTADDDHQIKPDAETKKLMRLASHNGNVSATIKEGSNPVEHISTSNYPMQEDVVYREDEETMAAALERAAEKIGRSIASRDAAAAAKETDSEVGPSE